MVYFEDIETIETIQLRDRRLKCLITDSVTELLIVSDGLIKKSMEKSDAL